MPDHSTYFLTLHHPGSMDFHSNICIIGNGAVGKAAALGFAQAGLSVTLLSPASASAQSAPTDTWDVRVYALSHVAQTLLSSIKAWDAMDASRIAPVDGMVINGDAAQGAGRLDFDAYSARTGALAWIVEDRNLNLALDTALKFAPNLKLVSGSATELMTSPDAVKVQLANGDTITAQLAVGADGGQSWVRNQCEIGMDYRSYGQRAIVTNFECEKPHHGVAHQWFTASEGIVALLPLPGQRLSLVWSAPDALADKLLSGSLTQLAERLCELTDHQFGTLKPLQPEAVKAFPLALLRPHAITAPRVALIGDAAHVVHPLAGQGMNLGFGDVASLLKVVAEREQYRDCGDARVLSRYARDRKEDILLMQIATDGLERLFSIDFEPLRVTRNLGLSLVNKLPFLKRQLVAHALGKKP